MPETFIDLLIIAFAAILITIILKLSVQAGRYHVKLGAPLCRRLRFQPSDLTCSGRCAVRNDVDIVHAPTEPLADPVTDDSVTGLVECYGKRLFT
jgi:hypothetical protein